MESIAEATPVASIELAGALLRALAGRDRSALAAELDRSIDLRHDTDTGEAERLQALSAVARRMRACGDPLTHGAQDPGLQLCIDLLVHLASRRA